MEVPGLLKSIWLFCVTMKESIQPSRIDLNRCPFWVQILNLPFNRMDKDTDELIGNKIGRYVDVDINDEGWTKTLANLLATRSEDMWMLTLTMKVLDGANHSEFEC
ncbi:hypothetical protein RJ640_024812 [Escallonia rubra]|uniref:DUF4283 domain-containing protein n=1 Tax=Escallonia rubra TaxID=112253 RepID=A0AA88QXA6_9ASTE|nr:hypothetical protein RJ640_024812 [Escallonia rubra]